MTKEKKAYDPEVNKEKQEMPEEAENSTGTPSPDDQLQDAETKARDYFSKLQRVQADFINYKRHIEQERSSFVQQAESDLILSILPVMDDLERALEATPEDIRKHSWVDGMRHIHRKLASILEGRGLKRIRSVGEAFDPNYHESAALAPGVEDKVVEEIKAGYTLYDKVLRPCTVLVGDGRQGNCAN